MVRVNYLYKMIKHMKNVFHIDELLKYLTDERVNITY